ncbi:MAG: IS256 family transposase, partial [Brevinema sp.]
KTIKNFFKGDMDRLFSALRTNGLTPNEINNISKKICGTSHSITKIQCSLNSEVIEFTKFNEARLKDIYEIIHVDSKFIKVNSSKSYKSAVMVIVGITGTGNKKILQMNDIDTESHNNVTIALQILKSRGVKNPSLFISDSSYGITSAIEAVYPRSDIQHCFFHSVMNFINVGVNKEDKSNIKSHIRKIFDYADFENIHEYIDNFINEFPEYAKTFCTMFSDKYLYTYMKYDKSLHKYLRTNNLLESINQKIDIHMSHSKYFNCFDHFGASLIKKVIEFNTKTTGEIAKETIAKIKSPTNIDFETLHEYIASKKANSDSFKHLILNDAGTKKHYFIENYKFKNLRTQIDETALKIKIST